MKEIQSTEHPIVKHLVKLREKRGYRSQCGSAILSGIKLVKELSPNYRFKTVLLEKNYSTTFPIHADQMYIVTPMIMKKVTGLVQPEPIAAEIDLPQEQNLSTKKYVLILDGISDPGNMGTLLRTALSLGWQGVWITAGSTDPFNEKALRAAKGATFKLPLMHAASSEIDTFLAASQRTLLAADIHGTPMDEIVVSGPIALVLGSEAHGLSASIKKMACHITIPMEKEMESLNVASAGAILMHWLKRRS